MKHAGYPILWKSKLQPDIALLMTEAEHIEFSTSLRETIPELHLLRETSAVMKIKECSKTMQCAVFEDNNGAL